MESPVLNRTSQTGDCAACTARGGKGTRLVSGVNDLETWCRQNNRLDILQAWSPNNQLKPSQVAARTDEVPIRLICSICHREIVTDPLHATKSAVSILCSHCRPQGTSVPQIALYEVIRNNFKDAEYRKKINGYEADIYIPSLKLAIEYNGFWHFDESVKQRDKEKAIEFSRLGITVLTVQENNDKDTSIAVDGVLPNKINLWYKLNTDKRLHREVLSWISQYYGVEVNLPDDVYDASLETARDTMTRRKVINSIVETHPEVATSWDYEKNGNLRPEMFTKGSHQEVYWVCKDCAEPHSYKMPIRKRCLGQGCPLKAGKTAQLGVNDLASSAPNLVKYCWDFEANGLRGLDPTKK